MLEHEVLTESALSHVARPRTVESAISVAIVGLIVLVDAPRRLSFAGQSGLALITIALVVLLALLLVARLSHRSRSSQALWPMYLFAGWVVLRTLAAGIVGGQGAQNVAVIITFVFGLTIATRQAFDDPKMGIAATRVLRYGSLLAAIVYLFTVAIGGLGTDVLLGARSLALAALIGFAAHLAALSRKRASALLAAGIVLTAIVASLSRSAILAALALICARELLSLRARGGHWQRAALSAVLLASLAWLGVNSVPALRDRVFGGDRAVAIGTAHINTSGRQAFWQVTEASIKTSPWVGHGAGSAERVMQSRFRSISHPHNDYLRIINDYGFVGLVLWTIGLLKISCRLVSVARSSAQVETRRVAIAAVMAVVALSIVMITDNVVVYTFVMAPVAVLLGAGIAPTLADSASRQLVRRTSTTRR